MADITPDPVGEECGNAIALDQLALVYFGGAEIAVIACDYHLRRVVLALDVLEALEQVEQIEIPALVDVAFRARLNVEPERTA